MDRQARKKTHLHHNLPMTMTSTTSPLCSSTYCSVLGGSISRPFALRIDISLLDTWLPGATGSRKTLSGMCLQYLSWRKYRRHYIPFCVCGCMFTCALCPGQWLLMMPGENTTMVLWSRIQFYIT